MTKKERKKKIDECTTRMSILMGELILEINKLNDLGLKVNLNQVLSIFNRDELKRYINK